MSDDTTRSRFSLQGRALADLGQQLVRARADNRELHRRLESVSAVLAAVVRQVEACEGALRFYADLQSYANGDAALVLDDSGWRARQVLYQPRPVVEVVHDPQAIRAALEDTVEPVSAE